MKNSAKNNSTKKRPPADQRLKKVAALSITVTLLLIILLLFALGNNDLLAPAGMIFAILSKTIFTIATFGSILLTIFERITMPHKRKIRCYITAFLFFTLISIPALACEVGGVVIDEVCEIYKAESSSPHTTDEQVTPTESTVPVIPAEDAICYEMNFKDAFFSQYSLEQLQNNRVDWAGYITLQLTAPSPYMYNVNFAKYEENISTVFDYEATYHEWVEKNRFLNNRLQRIHFLEECVTIRCEADYYYKTHINQNLIALRYADLAFERYHNDGTAFAIEAYQDAIYWQLESICTFYRESPAENENAQKMITQLIAYYQRIQNMLPLNDERHQRSSILIDIYEMVNEQIAA
ncbi:MAG: hypothetical protein J6A74_04300 [Oscillospiraceae bacterium]|nr:hypothetical protein [Oscillospiraceae bacterium]